MMSLHFCKGKLAEQSINFFLFSHIIIYKDDNIISRIAVLRPSFPSFPYVLGFLYDHCV